MNDIEEEGASEMHKRHWTVSLVYFCFVSFGV